jgi:hypothetical protein
MMRQLPTQIDGLNEELPIQDYHAMPFSRSSNINAVSLTGVQFHGIFSEVNAVIQETIAA